MARTEFNTKDVQHWLKRLGYYDGDVDGDYLGDEYRDALRQFQAHGRYQTKTYKGKIDGWYGPLTEAALMPLAETLEKATGVCQNAGEMRRWFNTYYYIGDERRWRGAKTVPMYDPKGKVIAKVAAGCYAEAALEGTTKLRDGRIVNVASGKYKRVDPDVFAGVYRIVKRNGWLDKPGYAGVSLSKDKTKVTGARRFYVKEVSPNGYPREAKGIPLDPFRTLAADNGRLRRHDPKWKGKGGLVPAGTRVFILEFVGREIPTTGEAHDGWFTVNDTGGGIYGAHFDVFTGSYELAKAFRPWPSRAHIWFAGIEGRIPASYSYGRH